MRANKITRWIDSRKYQLTLRITRSYYRNKESGKRLPAMRVSLIFAIIKRIFLLFISLFRFNKRLFAGYKGLPLGKLVTRILGLTRLEVTGLLPHPESFGSLSFPDNEHPLVSIIICVHNHMAYTYNCLLSILNNSGKTAYEIIIVDDCSTDETRAALARMTNLIIVRNEKNLGFLQSCNKALALARGQYVCFLNNDVQVHPGWLENLIVPFQQFDEVGLVGAKLIYPYGLLQEAGGIVNHKGQPANYGKFGDPDDILYNYLRQTDYCSGACILLRKADLDTLGGFDEAFSPAYYEDTDLAFRVRYRLHKKVYYQPLSRVVHFEGISSGKVSDGKNTKSYQDSNAEKFEERWASVFQNFPAITDATGIARKFMSNANTVLIVEPLLPTFDQDSGSRRMFELVKLFGQLNWNVIFSADARTQEEPYYSTLVNMGVWVLNKPKFQKSSTAVISRVMHWVDVAWVCRPAMNRRYGQFIKQFGVRWIYDTVDIHFLREQRALDLGLIPAEKAGEVERLKQDELALMRAADTVIAITKAEAALLADFDIRHAAVIPNIHSPVNMRLPGFEEREGICFIGGYRHLPNVDAVNWLINEIMPLVWEKLPSVQVYLLGSLAPPEVTRLSAANVHVPGYVADVSPYFSSSRVFVAPLRFGAGMKGKIGQSFEYGLPVITTGIGAEGMDLTDRENYLHAETASDFAAAIIELYNDPVLWAKLSAGGIEALEAYAPYRVIKKLSAVLA